MFWINWTIISLFCLAMIISGIKSARKGMANGYSFWSAVCNVYLLVPAAIISRVMVALIFTI